MAYWQNPVVFTVLALVVLLAVAESLRGIIGPMRRYGIPSSILAGIVGLGLGPDVLDVLSFDREVLESVVYHGLGVVFIAIGLQTPEHNKGHVASGVKSFSFGVPFMQAVQIVIGLGVVLCLGLVAGRAIHPGFGVMLPLGFESGPGQALALGAAWEQQGMQDGAQVGLIVAAIGFAWAIFFGVPLVAWGKRKGWVSSFSRREGDGRGDTVERYVALPAGALEHVTRQVVFIGVCYGITYVLCLGLATALASMPGIAAVVWGFHFMMGTLVAMALRPLLVRLPGGSPLHDGVLGRISNLAVDVMTCAALAAIQIAVLQANWLPIVLVTTLGGVVTLGVSIWFASRAFPDAPFEHCVVWFGMSTGTLPMGLALLRIIDPDLRSPAPMSAVLGSAGAIAGAVVNMMVIVPWAVETWPNNTATQGWVVLAAAAGYGALMLVLWRLFGPLRLRGSHLRWWVEEQRP